MKLATIWTVSSLLAAAVLGAAQTSKPPLLSQTFKDGPGGWMSIGSPGTVSVSHEDGIAQPNAGAVKLEYAVAKAQFTSLYMPVPLGSWANAKSIKLRLRADAATPLAIALQEQDGGRYVAMVEAPKDAWQTVELSTSDFILAQEKDDPKDPDGKLDMDRVAGIVIMDIAQFLMAGGDPAIQALFAITPGNHVLYMDSFTVGQDALPAGSASSGNDVQIETFAHPQVSWIALGGMKPARAIGKPMDGPALKVDYHQTPDKPALLSRPIPSWILTGTKTLSFDIASAQPAKMIVQIEQFDGGKYNMTFDLPGNSEVQHKNLLLAGFARGDDSKDNDTKIHLALVKSIIFIDISGMADKTDKDNTLWINHIKASS